MAVDDALFLIWHKYLKKHTHSLSHFYDLPAVRTTPRFSLLHLKVQTPMVFTSRIECATTLCAATPARQILIDTQHVLTSAAQYGSLAALRNRPYSRRVGLASVVAADAGVEAVAAGMLDGDDVEGRVPMRALGQRGDGEAVDGGRG
jgi:hypothetical protein